MPVEIELLKGPAKGSFRIVSEMRARALIKIGFARLGTSAYITRDMRAVEVPAVVMPEPVAAPPEPIESPTDDLDSMGVDELRALAESRDIKVHHRAGRAKILAALRGE